MTTGDPQPCPFCGGRLIERPDVIARALEDAPVAGVWIAIDFRPPDVTALTCEDCEHTFYSRDEE